MNNRTNTRVLLDTTDPERAEVYLTALFGGLMTASASGADYRFRHVRLGTGPVCVDTIEDTETTQYHADPLPVLNVIRIHRGTRTVLRTGDPYGPGDLGIHAQPGEPSDTRLENVRESVVQVPLDAVADAVRNHPDDDLGRLRFTTLRPASPAAAQPWLRTVDYITSGLTTNADAMAQPLVAGATTRLLAATLLTTFPNNWTPQWHPADRTDATSATLARAIEFIDANADLDIAVIDIARATHVTVRAVQIAFRRHLDTTPTAYLRRVRLDRAHHQLKAASPGDGTTVTAVAARWGYASPSQFTSRYRQVYGQLPRQTLQT